MGSVDVGDEVKLNVRVAVRLESLGDHYGAARCRCQLQFPINQGQESLQIGTTDTNVDDGVDLLAGVTLPLAAADLLGELLHVLQDGVNILNHALAIDLHGLVGNIAQSSVVDSTILGEVDVLTTEHSITELLNVSLLGELDQKRDSLLGQEVLGEIEENLRVVYSVDELVAEVLEALGVLLELILKD